MSGALRLAASNGLPLALAAVTSPATFGDFVEAEGPALFRRLCLVTGNRYEAEEVLQDALLKVLERWDRVREMEDPTGYLYRTAFNTFRKRWRRTLVAARKAIRLAPNIDEFAAADDRRVVAQALSKLTPRQRAALVLTAMLGYSSEEAGQILGVRAVTVRTLTMQGREEMRRDIGVSDG
jgi:RNA polymerase sigma factor (sigma-70 family)